MNPIVIGSTGRQTATQLAEAAIERMGKGTRYAVGLDWKGHVFIAGVADVSPRELLMVCVRTSDPDDLADVIRDEVNARDPDYTQKSHRVFSRKRA